MSVEDFLEALHAQGRNDGPVLLFEWWWKGRLGVEDLRQVIANVWSMAEFPARDLGVLEWVRLFRASGFVADDGSAAPVEPFTIHRGTTWGRRRGMSWTTDFDKAAWFAERHKLTGGAGEVFTVTVDPVAVLALINEWRNESEVVVDPTLLPPVRRTSRVPGVSRAAGPSA